MKPENIILTEVPQTQKNKHDIYSFMNRHWVLSKEISFYNSQSQRRNKFCRWTEGRGNGNKKDQVGVWRKSTKRDDWNGVRENWGQCENLVQWKLTEI